jgi:hypothetical protein
MDPQYWLLKFYLLGKPTIIAGKGRIVKAVSVSMKGWTAKEGPVPHVLISIQWSGKGPESGALLGANGRFIASEGKDAAASTIGGHYVIVAASHVGPYAPDEASKTMRKDEDGNAL